MCALLKEHIMPIICICFANCTLLIICCNFMFLRGAYVVRDFFIIWFYKLNETGSCMCNIYNVFMLQMFEMRLGKEERDSS